MWVRKDCNASWVRLTYHKTSKEQVLSNLFVGLLWVALKTNVPQRLHFITPWNTVQEQLLPNVFDFIMPVFRGFHLSIGRLDQILRHQVDVVGDFLHIFRTCGVFVLLIEESAQVFVNEVLYAIRCHEEEC